MHKFASRSCAGRADLLSRFARIDAEKRSVRAHKAHLRGYRKVNSYSHGGKQMKGDREMEIQSNAILTAEGCIELLENLREWLRHNISVVSLEELEKASDELLNTQTTLQGTWDLNKTDSRFLMGALFGMTLFQSSLSGYADPLFGFVHINNTERTLAALVMTITKQGIRVHTNG